MQYRSPLVTRTNALKGGSTYTFSCLASAGTILGRSAIDIKVRIIGSQFQTILRNGLQINAPPSGGSVSVTPASGREATDVFTLATRGWTDEIEDLPLEYNFGYSFEIINHTESCQDDRNVLR